MTKFRVRNNREGQMIIQRTRILLLDDDGGNFYENTIMSRGWVLIHVIINYCKEARIRFITTRLPYYLSSTPKNILTPKTKTKDHLPTHDSFFYSNFFWMNHISRASVKFQEEVVSWGRSLLMGTLLIGGSPLASFQRMILQFS